MQRTHIVVFIVLILTVCTFIFSFDIASAQTRFFPDGLVPCGQVRDSGTPAACLLQCNMCSLVQLSQNVVNFLIYSIGLVATIMIAYMGVMLMFTAPNPDHIQRVRGMVTTLLKGAFYIIIAWLAVDVIFKVFYDGELGPWNDILCLEDNAVQCIPIDYQTQPFQPPAQGGGPVGSPPPPGSGPAPAPGGEVEGVDAGQLDHNAAALALGAPTCDQATAANAVCITSTQGAAGVQASCTDANGNPIPRCTTLNGINQSTVDYLNGIANDCKATNPNCQMVVTGGSECGAHAAGTNSHCNGYKIDINRGGNAASDAYIESIMAQDPNPQVIAGVGTRYTVPDGNGGTIRIIQEGSHYDIQVCPPGSACDVL